jgi:hypothetical protein
MSNHYEFLKIDSTASSEDNQKSIELKREFCKQQNNELKTTNIFEQLEEIENILLDPIRRSEYNRKLQKEQKNKKIQEQITKEQKEIKSFQIESLEVKPSIPELIISESDRKIKSESDIKQKSTTKQEEKTIAIAKINQTSVTSTSQTEPIYSTTSGLQDWQKSVLTGSAIGIFFFAGFMFMKPNTSYQQLVQKPVATSTKIPSQNSNIDSQQVNKPDEILHTSFDLNNKKIRESVQPSSKLKIISNNYPLDACGDKDPGSANTWYPVYVNSSEENLEIIHRNYCRDAFRKYRKEVGIESIQVASFIDRAKAESFAELIRQDFNVSEVGKPYVYGLNNTSVNYYSEDSSSNDNYEEIDENASISSST